MWLTPGVHNGIKIPERLYPAFAPLPVPFAQHLVIQEYRRCRRIATRKRPIPPEPPPEVFWQAVLTRVQRARSIVFEVMHPFVLADAQKRRRGRGLSFPDTDWLLKTLAANAPPAEPESREYTILSLRHWQKRGLLTREWELGPFDQTSVAAFLTARIAEEVYENKWLPSDMAPDEPRWWCYGQERPGAEIISLPVPLPDGLPASMILWTPWHGAVWHEEWRLVGSVACRWASPCASEAAITVWDESMVTQIHEALQHIPFGKQAVYDILLAEARKILLERHVFPHGL